MGKMRRAATFGAPLRRIFGTHMPRIRRRWRRLPEPDLSRGPRTRLHVAFPPLSVRGALQQVALLEVGASGHTDDALLEHGVFTSDCALLRKPITPGGLSLEIREVLE